MPVLGSDDVAAGVRHSDIETLHLKRALGRLVRLRRLVAFSTRRPELALELLAEKPGGVGVVVDAEHELVARRVQARAAPDHLVEGDGRAHVLEEDDVPDAGDVHARREEVHRGGDEVVARSSLLAAPRGVEIVQGDSYVLGVPVARAEDDGLLLGPDRRQEVPEEVPAHRLDAIG